MIVICFYYVSSSIHDVWVLKERGSTLAGKRRFACVALEGVFCSRTVYIGVVRFSKYN